MNFPRQIYMIWNNKTGKIYIGSSKNASWRFRNHLSRLRCGTHPVNDMQVDFMKYGEDFSFHILGEIKTIDEKRKEQAWMFVFNSYVREFGYNYNDPTFRKGNVNMTDLKKELSEIIETLDENEARFILAFTKRFFGLKDGESNGNGCD